VVRAGVQKGGVSGAHDGGRTCRQVQSIWGGGSSGKRQGRLPAGSHWRVKDNVGKCPASYLCEVVLVGCCQAPYTASPPLLPPTSPNTASTTYDTHTKATSSLYRRHINLQKPPSNHWASSHITQLA
jgi:hypothetical protein